jgi:hypothetical protein
MLFRRTQLVNYTSLSPHLHRKIHQTIFPRVYIPTVNFFYLTNHIHSILRPLRVTAGKAALADIPIPSESWSMRFRSMYCKFYHSSFLSYLKKVTEKLSFGSETRLTSNKHVFHCTLKLQNQVSRKENRQTKHFSYTRAV